MKPTAIAEDAAAYSKLLELLGTPCEDITTLRDRLRRIDREIERTLEAYEVGRLLTTIDGIDRPCSAMRR